MSDFWATHQGDAAQKTGMHGGVLNRALLRQCDESRRLDRILEAHWRIWERRFVCRMGDVFRVVDQGRVSRVAVGFQESRHRLDYREGPLPLPLELPFPLPLFRLKPSTTIVSDI